MQSAGGWIAQISVTGRAVKWAVVGRVAVQQAKVATPVEAIKKLPPAGQTVPTIVRYRRA